MADTERHRILLVEDEHLLRSYMVRGLRDLPNMNIDVIEASTVGDALAALRQGGLALIISDLDLPDGSGVELVGATATSDPDLPMIFLSGYLGEFRQKIPPRDNISLHEKPMPIAELCELVTKLLVAKQQKPEKENSTLPFSAVDLVQLACMGRHSIKLCFGEAGLLEGEIEIREGNVWSAFDLHGTGPEAFQRLLFGDDVRTRCEALTDMESQRNIEQPWESLLLNAAREADELSRAVRTIPTSGSWSSLDDDGWEAVSQEWDMAALNDDPGESSVTPVSELHPAFVEVDEPTVQMLSPLFTRPSEPSLGWTPIAVPTIGSMSPRRFGTITVEIEGLAPRELRPYLDSLGEESILWVEQCYEVMCGALIEPDLELAENLGVHIRFALLALQEGAAGVPRAEIHSLSLSRLVRAIGAIVAGDSDAGMPLLSSIVSTLVVPSPLRWTAWIWLSRAASRSGNLRAELAAIRMARALAAEFDRGQTDEHGAGGHWAESTSDLPATIQSEDASAQSLSLAREQARRGDITRAWANATRAKMHTPDDEEPDILLAQMALLRGNALQARNLLLARLNKYGDSSQVRKELVLAERARSGELPMPAVKEFARLRLCPIDSLLADHMMQLLKSYPDFAELRDLLTTTLVKLGRVDEARNL